MAILSAVRDLFQKKKTIDQVQPDEIRRERIKLEQNETRVTREIELLEKQKEEFFRKGVEGGSERQKLQIARKIKELDSQVRAKDKQLALVSKNLRVLSGLAQIKENSDVLKNLGVSGLLSKMNLDDVQAYIEKATIEGQFQMERFTGLLDAMESGDSLDNVAGEDADTRAILEAMNAAAQMKSDVAIAEGIKKVDEILHSKGTEPDPLS